MYVHLSIYIIIHNIIATRDGIPEKTRRNLMGHSSWHNSGHILVLQRWVVLPDLYPCWYGAGIWVRTYCTQDPQVQECEWVVPWDFYLLCYHIQHPLHHIHLLQSTSIPSSYRATCHSIPPATQSSKSNRSSLQYFAVISCTQFASRTAQATTRISMWWNVTTWLLLLQCWRCSSIPIWIGLLWRIMDGPLRSILRLWPFWASLYSLPRRYANFIVYVGWGNWDLYIAFCGQPGNLPDPVYNILDIHVHGAKRAKPLTFNLNPPIIRRLLVHVEPDYPSDHYGRFHVLLD